ncbi:MAG: putative methyltransferase [Paraglaciecola sp.]|jgi:predicted methyltransferase
MKTSLLILLLASASFSAVAVLSPFQEKVLAIIEMEHRTEADIERDRNRDPIYALEFFGLKEDLKVIEFAPGNGWYTKILAPLLKKR